MLPPEVRTLAASFREGAVSALGANLWSLFLLGSVAFPDFHPWLVDIDFHAVTSRELTDEENDALEALHLRLAGEHDLGSRLDGYYMLLAEIGADPPETLVGAAHGTLKRRGVRRDRGGWTLERAHVHAGRFVLLHGRDPRDVYPPPEPPELEDALVEELGELAPALDRYPAYAALNLCRLAFSFETGNVVVSKAAAGEWAGRGGLPRRWQPTVAAALLEYRGSADAAALERVRAGVHELYRFVAAQYSTRAR